MEENIKLYSQKTIALATYLGGPLAAGFLIRQNCINLNRDRQGLNSLLIGLLSTFLIFAALISVPEEIIDKIPNVIFPAIYAGIVYLIVEKIQGDDLKKHKENSGEFYSNWKASAIAVIGMLIILAGIFGYVYATEPNYNFDTVSYDNDMEIFFKNEKKSILVFNVIENADRKYLIKEFSEGIVIWKENKSIIARMDEIENLPEEFKKQNRNLNNYCDFRITQYDLITKALSENTDFYDKEIEDIVNKIDNLIEEMNK